MARGKKLLPFLVITAVVFGVYINTLGHSFTYDDHHYIVESEYIRGWNTFFSVFGMDYQGLSPEWLDLTRPLMPFSLTLDHSLWGLRPFGYHLTNTVLHLLNAVLVYILAGYISSGLVPLTASLLFALHPIHVEAVVGVTFREDLLVTLFFLFSLLFYVIYRVNSKKRYYLLSLLSFFLALLSKEMAVTLLFVLLSYEYFLNSDWKNIKTLYILPYLAILPVYLLFLYYIYSNLATPPAYVGNISTIIITIMRVLAYDVRLMLFPFNLSVDYDIPLSTTPLDLGVLFSIVLISSSVLYLLRARNRVGSFCIAFFLVTLMPVLNIIPTFNFVADRFLYLPSVGFCMFFAVIVSEIRQKLIHTSLRDRVSILIVIGTLVFYAVTAFGRGIVWKDDFTLWSDVLKKSPMSVKAYTAIGTSYLREGRDDDALNMFKKAVELRPDYDKGYYNLGVVCQRKGYVDAAILYFKKAVEITPRYAKAHFNLGLSYAKKGKYDEAIAEYEEALKSMSSNAALYNNLGNAYSAKGMYERALTEYGKAVSIDPNYAEAYYNMGNAIVKMGMYAQSLHYYEKAITLDPINASAYFNMGNVYLYLGQTDKARSKYEATLSINPVHRGALNALELINQGKGQ